MSILHFRRGTKLKKAYVVALLLSSIMCFGLAGCTSGTESTREIPETSVSDGEDDEEEVDDEIEESVNTKKLDSDWLKKVEEYYIANRYSDSYGLYSFSDVIPGSFSYSVNDSNNIYLYYNDVSGGKYISMHINDVTEVVSICVDLQYSDGTRFYVYGEDVEYNGIEGFFDNLTTCEWDTLDDDSALADHDVDSDAKILYSRFINSSDVAFSKVDTSLDEYGIVLGNKYREIDPSTHLSEEPDIVNEHVFEDGVCKDCDMSWISYVRSSIAELDLYRDENGGWVSVYGPDGEYNICPSDYVQYSSDDGYVSFYYHNFAEDDTTVDFIMNIDEYNPDEISMQFGFEEEYYSVDIGVVDATYEYVIRVSCAPEEVAEVFASKKSLMDSSEIYLIYSDEESESLETYEMDLSDEDIAALFGDSECEYRTKDDMYDLFWEYHENFLDGIECGLNYMDTSLADYNITY